jgi:hypothetical protein
MTIKTSTIALGFAAGLAGAGVALIFKDHPCSGSWICLLGVCCGFFGWMERDIGD